MSAGDVEIDVSETRRAGNDLAGQGDGLDALSRAIWVPDAASCGHEVAANAIRVYAERHRLSGSNIGGNWSAIGETTFESAGTWEVADATSAAGIPTFGQEMR